ncbi:hypothetical protein [Synechococcus sp. WH 8020]|uniref:hypothetical protein n=1 Tax=Synechococcus sp. (strain WH8020) TaxID=32052 RepID=UPI001FDFDBDF|nr:hypothetical protein [Synechococcus sp. WH 8020]
MQLIRLVRDDFDFFCPVTGKAVFTEGEVTASSFCGAWSDMVPEEPADLHPELQQAWDRYWNKLQDHGGDLDITSFLESIDQPNWVAFEITVSGMACGPITQTSWTVLDLG